MMVWNVGLAVGCLVLVVACGGEDPPMDSGDGGASVGSGGAGGTGGVVEASSGGSGGRAPSCFDSASFVPTPTVDFAADVMPIFASHCNDATCHGTTNKPDGNLYLGSSQNNDAATLDLVYANLVGAQAARAPSMQRVAAAEIANSFLMIKLDEDFDCPQVACVSLGCGSKMPYGIDKPLLPQASRDVIRSWIANGAPR
jgi:hypothetical protein